MNRKRLYYVASIVILAQLVIGLVIINFVDPFDAKTELFVVTWNWVFTSIIAWAILYWRAKDTNG